MRFKCLNCHLKLQHRLFENRKASSSIVCSNCKSSYSLRSGFADFTKNTNDVEERDYYNTLYSNRSIKREILDKSELNAVFNPVNFPGYHYILKKLGNIQDKKILLLGNGISHRELFFLFKGAKLIFTDLSIEASVKINQKFDLSQFSDSIEFAAVDAMNIPLADNSVDIVYAYAFVHHLSSNKMLYGFLRETNRVLSSGGFSIFFDNSHSNIWQKSKFGILQGAVNFSHKKEGISPNDLIATKKGGFTKKEVYIAQKYFDMKSSYFHRFDFFSYLFRRFFFKFFSWSPRTVSFAKILLPFFIFVDNSLSKIHKFNESTINLMWGFKK